MNSRWGLNRWLVEGPVVLVSHSPFQESHGRWRNSHGLVAMINKPMGVAPST